jgi:hypothetical protein
VVIDATRHLVTPAADWADARTQNDLAQLVADLRRLAHLSG